MSEDWPVICIPDEPQRHGAAIPHKVTFYSSDNVLSAAVSFYDGACSRQPPGANEALSSAKVSDFPTRNKLAVSEFKNHAGAISLIEEDRMLKWAIIFFIISLVAGLLGFSGISAASAGIAKVLFYIALAIFLVFLVLAFMAGSIAF